MALVTKLTSSKNENTTTVPKNSQACGKTSMTGRAMADAQPSSVKTCNNVNIDEPRLAKLPKTSPYKLMAIIAKT